jgi:hypothetical protein
MPAPTTSIYLNSTTPAAPTGNQNVKPQTDGATPEQSISFYPQQATSDLLGVVKPDGISITVDDTGTISSTSTLSAPVLLITPTTETEGLIIRGSNTIAAGWVQGTSYVLPIAGDSGGDLTETIAFSSPVTAGNAIVVIVSGADGETDDLTITDSLSNTYTQIALCNQVTVFIALNISGGANTVSVYGNPLTAGCVLIAEYAGLVMSSAFDTDNTLYYDSYSEVTPSSPNLSMTTSSSDLILTIFASDAVCTPGAAEYTTRLTASNSADDSGTLCLADTVGAAGSYSAAWTSTSFSDMWSALLIGLKGSPSSTQVAPLAVFEDASGDTLSEVNARGQIVLPSTSGLPTNSPLAGALAYDSTTQSPVIYNGSAWVSISSGGGGGSGSGGGALVLLQEQTASNSATLDFTSWYGSDFDSIFIELVNVTAATSGVGILMQVSTNGGSTWDTDSNYNFFDWAKGVAAPGYQAYNQHGGMSAFQWWGPDANDMGNSVGFSGTGHLLNVTGSNIVGAWRGIGQSTSGYWYEIEYGVTYSGTGPVNGIQFLMTSGNIASGIIRIYGISNSGSSAPTTTVGARASLPGTVPASGSVYKCTDSPYEYVSNGTAWLPFIYGYNVVEPILANFTQVNTSATTIDDTHGGLLLSVDSGDNNNNVQLFEQAIPSSGAYYIDAAMLISSWTTNSRAGVVTSGGMTASDVFAINGFGYESSTSWVQEVSVFNTPTDWNNNALETEVTTGAPLIWTRVYDDGTTNLTFYMSTNGYTWRQLYQMARTTYFTPGGAGFGISPYDGNIDVHLVHFSVHT